MRSPAGGGGDDGGDATTRRQNRNFADDVARAKVTIFRAPAPAYCAPLLTALESRWALGRMTLFYPHFWV
jgi:hypothetical protein